MHLAVRLHADPLGKLTAPPQIPYPNLEGIFIRKEIGRRVGREETGGRRKGEIEGEFCPSQILKAFGVPE